MRWIYIVFVFLLAGCSSSPSPVLPPSPLLDFEKSVDVYIKWSTEIGTGAYDHYLKFAPVFFNNIGYVADHMGMLRAFDVNTGETIWDKHLDAHISAGPSIAEGLLLVGTHSGDVIALSPENGDKVWQSKISSEVLASPVGAQGYIIVRTVDGNLFSLNALTGVQRWVYERTVPLLTLRGNSRPMIVNDMVLIGADSGKLTALTLKDGIELWEVAVSIPTGRTELERIIDIDADPVVFEDLIYIVSYQGRLAAVQIQNGRLLWVRDMSSYTGITVDAYRIYLT
ncbi:MAG: outer membrane protein assembly factor BamB, partial [Gammaproteobacteria bacterium]|nr:outer membrane protein assembly factor BamB [Gammaproteobacteria bacterium]